MDRSPVLEGCSGVRAPKPNAFPFFAPDDEFNPCLGQRCFDCLNGTDAGIDNALLQARHGVERYDRLVCQLLLGPPEEGTGGSNLSCTDHIDQKPHAPINRHE